MAGKGSWCHDRPVAVIGVFPKWGLALCDTHDGWVHVVSLEGIQAMRSEVEPQLDAGVLPALAEGLAFGPYEELDDWCWNVLEDLAWTGRTGTVDKAGLPWLNSGVVARRLASATILPSRADDVGVLLDDGRRLRTAGEITAWLAESERTPGDHG